MDPIIPVFHSAPASMETDQCFPGTNVRVQKLVDYLEAGDSINGFLEDYPIVRRDQAVVALQLAREKILGQGHLR